MRAIEQALVSFFEQVAQKDEILLNKLRQESRFNLTPEHWCFTLPDFYSFLQRQDVSFRAIEYRQFRRALFNSPVNKTIEPYGAEIIIVDQRGKVDQSGYALIWRNSEGQSKKGYLSE